MKKFAPSIISLVVTLAIAASPEMQHVLAAHPLVASIVAGAASILNHWLPSPAQGA